MLSAGTCVFINYVCMPGKLPGNRECSRCIGLGSWNPGMHMLLSLKRNFSGGQPLLAHPLFQGDADFSVAANAVPCSLDLIINVLLPVCNVRLWFCPGTPTYSHHCVILMRIVTCRQHGCTRKCIVNVSVVSRTRHNQYIGSDAPLSLNFTCSSLAACNCL